MKIRFAGFALLVLHAGSVLTAGEDRLRFDSPATHFTQSSPLGNGRLGAMVFGGVDEERIVLNENGLWSGSPQDADRPDAVQALPEIRRLLLAGQNVEAEKQVNAHFTSAGPGSGNARGANLPYGSYQVLGNLRLRFSGDPTANPIHDYRRELDLAQAVAHVSYERGGVTFTREVFASAPAEAIVVRLTASQSAALSLTVALDRPENFQVAAIGPADLLMTGQLPDGKNGATGVRYAARLRAVARGGKITARTDRLEIDRADEVLLLITAATDIKTFAGRHVTDAVQAANDDLERAALRSFSVLRAEHVADHQHFYQRVRLRLGATDSAPAYKTTPARLAASQAGASDPGLMELYFNFGRYLLIASSRPGGLPANLQGLWAEEIQAPWNADWHLNVNVQMNYWPAEVCNLSELHQPLFALIGSLQIPGARTAQSYYGARGWVAHVLANPWGFTSPGESASWGSATSGSAWLCQHLWDHYLFTGDKDFLSQVYPIMRGSAQFYLDLLIEEPTHHWLVTAPSNSPENAFTLPDGSKAHVCMGPTIDQQLLRYLFTACIEASTLLGRDEPLRAELIEKRARLAPTRIGPDGRIMEWLENYGEPEPQHRHVSHLWGLYPGLEISAQATPELATAARKSLEARGDEGTGWSLAYKLNLWARLRDGDRAERILRTQLKPAGETSIIYVKGGGTYPNLFDAHPPFQIDGNFGATAGIAEMLLQSHAGEIDLLPALPSAWPEGEVSGLKARGGITVDVAWEKGRVTHYRLTSATPMRVKVRLNGEVREVTTTVAPSGLN
jgi:alpha-L-fucosidase 2